MRTKRANKKEEKDRVGGPNIVTRGTRNSVKVESKRSKRKSV